MFSNNLLMAAAGGGVDLVEVGNSGLFNSANNEYLSWTPSSASDDQKTWTFSTWIYRGADTTEQRIFGGQANACHLYFTDASILTFDIADTGSSSPTGSLDTSMVFRDYSAWYHIVAVVDTSQATDTLTGSSTDRMRLYVNGNQVTSFASTTVPAQNYESCIGDSGEELTIGRRTATQGSAGMDLDAYLAETVFLDGTASLPSVFAEASDDGLYWTPKSSDDIKDLTFGTNGFYLDNSITQGHDASGNANHFDLNNFTQNAYPTSNMTSNSAPNPLVASASSEDTPSGSEAFRAFGGSSTWRTTSGAGGVANLDLDLGSGNGIAVDSVTMECPDAARAPQNFTIEGSNTGSFSGEETTLLTKTSVSWSAGVAQTFCFTNTTAYRYLRMDCTATSGSTYVEITEMDYNVGAADLSTHTPTNQFALFNPLNPLAYNTGRTLSNGNKTFVDDDAGGVVTTLPLPETGKWKAEFSLAGSTPSPQFGIVDALVDGDFYKNVQYYCSAGANNGTIREGGSTIDSSLTTWTSSDTVTLLIDMDARTAVFKIADVDIGGAGSPYTIADNGRPVFIGVYDGSATCTITLNNGDGGFTYTDADYNALNTTNIAAETTRTVSDPYEHWNNFLYTGTGSSNSLTGVGFQPDFAIIKRRDALATSLYWYDVVRGAGAGNAVYSSADVAEGTYAEYGVMSSFDNDGITVTTGTTDDNGTNNTSSTYVTWLAKLGGAAASNEDGSITSAVSANTTLRMSCGTYTGTGSAATIGHGLGATPGMVLIKDRDVATYDWQVYHSGVGNTASLGLNTTDAISTDISYWNDTDPTSSVFTVGTSVALNKVSTNYVFYAFAPSEFISIGSYTGNGNADGSMISCISSSGIPLMPIWTLHKKSSGAGKDWRILDAGRNEYNALDAQLAPNLTNVEFTSDAADFVSGGIKLRSTSGDFNDSSSTYIRLTIGIPVIDKAGRILTAR